MRPIIGESVSLLTALDGMTTLALDVFALLVCCVAFVRVCVAQGVRAPASSCFSCQCSVLIVVVVICMCCDVIAFEACVCCELLGRDAWLSIVDVVVPVLLH